MLSTSGVVYPKPKAYSQTYCKDDKRETMTGNDILHALENLSFENYIKALKRYSAKYYEVSTLGFSSYTVRFVLFNISIG